VATLPQTLYLPPSATVRDVVIGTAWLPSGFAAEHEWAGDAGVRAILDGLGMPHLGLDQPVGPMSGGERRRVVLAALLVRAADVLVLDEPTNHLDIAGVDWLARHLVDRRGAVVVVTHDRWFLDEVTSRTWEVVDRTVREYEGGFAAWTLARAERERLAAAAEARRQNLLRKEVAWLRRGPPARTSKPRFRIEAANALIADEPPPRGPVGLHRLATARLGKQVYELERVTLDAGPKRILDGVSWHIGPGDRIAVLGANGAGKTTLLRLLAGALAPTGGRLIVGATVRAAYLSQELTDDRDPDRSAVDRAHAGSGSVPESMRVLEAIEEVARRVRVGDRELSAAQLAEMFGLGGRRLWTPVGDLSGGERRRLQMLRLLAAEPNVLLLDEPTNDLDTDTLAALEDVLDSWPGTVVVASHDRYLVERVTDDVYALFGDGRLVHLPGGVDEYLAALASRGPRPPRTARSAATGATGGHRAGSGGGSRASGSERRRLNEGRASAAGVRQLRKDLARMERQVARLEQQEARLHDEMAAHTTDFAKVAELDARLRAVQSERAGVEESWLGLAEGLPDA
jgi:ATPase subunit of ABC transporter with duplicated ATPase domains